jgi:fluoride ion exporter CrcB/FEX
MEPLIILLVVGAIGGIVRSIIGYEAQSDIDERFDYKKALKSVIRAAVIGSFIVIGTTSLTNSEITTATYITAFFIAMGADVLVKEGFQTVRPT